MGKSDGYDKNAPWYVRLSFVFHAQFLLTLKQGSGLNRKNAEKSTTDTTAKIRHHPSRGSTNHGRMHPIEVCKEIIDAFIAEPFSDDERHIRRIGLISKFEKDKTI